FLFGPWLGAALSVLGATIGASVLFLAARYAFADLLRQRAGPAIRKMEVGFQENALSYMLFLRLVPAFPFFLVNLVPAFLGVRFRTYVLGTFIGIIPGSLVYASLGDGFSAVVEKGGDIDLGVIFEPRFLLPIIGLAILALLPVVYKKLRKRAA
ncbi:MAG TPA: VTT domain-containing protein, partial [Parvularculaceae bacterium]|nr:VTT domain-containing protein [Parvularculaceae bacterium]